MNTYTQGVWEILGEALLDDEALSADLKKILCKDYRMFLSDEQSNQVYTNTVQEYFLEKLNQWYDWLPPTTINLIGGQLTLEAFKAVEWPLIAEQVREHFEREQEPCRRQKRTSSST